MCLEILSRRLSQIVEANARGTDSPNWEAVKHYSGVRSAVDLVPTELRSYARRLDREDPDSHWMRNQRPFGGGGASGAADGAGAAAAAGGLGRGGDRKGKKGDGKGGRGRGAQTPPAVES